MRKGQEIVNHVKLDVVFQSKPSLRLNSSREDFFRLACIAVEFFIEKMGSSLYHCIDCRCIGSQKQAGVILCHRSRLSEIRKSNMIIGVLTLMNIIIITLSERPSKRSGSESKFKTSGLLSSNNSLGVQRREVDPPQVGRAVGRVGGKAECNHCFKSSRHGTCNMRTMHNAELG